MHSILESILLLKQVPIFEMLRTDQLRYAVPLLETVEWVRGERVFDLGEPSDDMYIIVSGRVGISVNPDPTKKIFIAEIKAGECFGEMGILDELPRSATVHVLEDTKALALGKEKLRGLLLAYPEFGLGMLRAMSLRLRTASSALAQSREQEG